MFRTLDRVADYAVPALLIGVATLQLYRVRVHDLSAWKGGGFGMFSTVDGPGARYLRFYLITAGGDLEVPPPPDEPGLLQRTRTLPSRAGLEALADQMAEATWMWADYDPLDRVFDPAANAGWRPEIGSSACRVAGVARPVEQCRVRWRRPEEPNPPAGAVVGPTSVRVELWRLRYDGREGLLRTRRQLTVTRPLGASEVHRG